MGYFAESFAELYNADGLDGYGYVYWCGQFNAWMVYGHCIGYVGSDFSQRKQ